MDNDIKDVFVRIPEKSWLRRIFGEKDYVSIEDIFGKLEDQYDEIDELKEKYDDLKDDLEENYELKKFDPYDYYGVSKEDFE